MAITTLRAAGEKFNRRWKMQAAPLMSIGDKSCPARPLDLSEEYPIIHQHLLRDEEWRFFR
jgi:hypothetical protein